MNIFKTWKVNLISHLYPSILRFLACFAYDFECNWYCLYCVVLVY